MDNKIDFIKADQSSLLYRIISHLLFAPLWFVVVFIVIGTISAILYFSEAISSFPWLIFLIVGIVLVAWTSLTAYLSYINLGYFIEENGLKFREGIFALHTQTIPYSKITNASFKQ